MVIVVGLQTENMTTENSLYTDLKTLKEMVYDKCGFEFTNLKLNLENIEYGACSFELNRHKIIHRVSKITPTKTGQFVTIWKRNEIGITEPFDILDDFDFLVITTKKNNNIGQFIFPKSVLADKGIITQNGIIGKRGVRVYPNWDMVTNKQAEKTQRWQTKYFVTIEPDNSSEFNLLKSYFIKQIESKKEKNNELLKCK